MASAAVTTVTANTNAIVTGDGGLYAVLLTSVGDAATVTVYDNTAQSGTILCKLATAAAATSVAWCPGVKMTFHTGLSLTVSGTTPVVTVVYVP